MKTIKKTLFTIKVLYHIKRLHDFSWRSMVKRFLINMEPEQRREALYYAGIDYRNRSRRGA